MIYTHTGKYLEQLRTLLMTLSEAQFTEPLPVLGGISIARHVRHILEFYDCLFNSLHDGILDYDARCRNAEMESSLAPNLLLIQDLSEQVAGKPAERPLLLRANLSAEAGAPVEVPTSLHRELLYNIEHLVHHLALIRIGIESLPDGPEIPENLGVSAATQRNRNLCAQ